jgi:hypothetical protein
MVGIINLFLCEVLSMKTLNDTRYIFTIEEVCHSLGLKYEDVHSMESSMDEIIVVMVTEEKT